mgnify:CR=1 FL=1
MTWVTWRQHRLEGLWALLLATLLGGLTAYVAYQISLASASCAAPRGQAYCLPGDAWGQIAQGLLQFNLSQYGLVVLPALAGAFIGAPLVAREIENGTQHLAWTQGVTRLRWLLAELFLVIVPVVVAAAVVGYLEVIFLNVQGSAVNRWDVFDQQTPVVPAATLLALALGVAFGALIGRSVPAMAATLVTFVVLRVGIAELARANYVAPLRFKTTELSQVGSPRGNPTAWWLGNPDFYDSAGHLFRNGPGGGAQPSYAIQYFQPGARFWAFQTIESAILAGLALLVLGFAVYWVTKRVT